MKRFLAIILGAALVFSLGTAVLAGESTAVENEGDTEVENFVIVDNIIAAFPDLALSADQISALEQSGWGYGEIIIAASLASKSGKTLDEILALYQAGEGWGEIAKSLGLPVGKFGPIISAIVSQGKHHKKGQTADPALEDPAIDELIRVNFGQGKKANFDQLRAEYKLTHRELITAITVARASGDETALQTALDMRAQNSGWKAIMDQLKVDVKGVMTHGNKDKETPNKEKGSEKGNGNGNGSASGNGKNH